MLQLKCKCVCVCVCVFASSLALNLFMFISCSIVLYCLLYSDWLLKRGGTRGKTVICVCVSVRMSCFVYVLLNKNEPIPGFVCFEIYCLHCVPVIRYGFCF